MRNALIFMLSCMLTTSYAQNTNVTFNAMMTFPGQRLANIWGYADGGNEYALVGAHNGLIIVDVTSPSSPQQIVQIPGVGSNWREIKTYQHYAYVISEGPGSKIQIVDLSGLPSSNLTYHSVTGGSAFDNGHALHIDEITGYLYVYGANINDGKTMVFNLNPDPYNPTYVGFVNFIGYVHDGFVENDMLYSAHIYEGKFAIINMANKTNPVLLGSKVTPGAFTHNTWKSGTALFTTDEVSLNSFLTSYDVSNPSNITELDKIQISPGTNSIVHNTHVINDYAVTSWYKDGFAIIDVNRPANMVEVGRYDTYSGSGSGFEGCWGVYPYLPSGTIVASNIRAPGTANDGELWVLTPDYVRGCYLEGTVTDADTGFPLNNASVSVLSGTASGTTNASGDYKIGQLTDGAFTVNVSKSGYFDQSIAVNLDHGVLTTLNVALIPKGPLPVELTHFNARLDGRDALLFWETASELNNAGFEVQYSDNSGQNWQTHGWVSAQGDGTSPASYSYRVPDLKPGKHLFRLRQIDLDGSSDFSPIRTLNVYAAQLAVEVWPNPVVSGQSNLRIRTGRKTSVQVDLLNTSQQIVALGMAVEVDSETIVPLNLSQLAAGVYTLRVREAQEQQQVLLIKN